MHYRLFAFLLVLTILASGCISGQVAKRQAAEPPAGNLSQNASATIDYEMNAPEEECTCMSSIRTCPDGFNATCENECTNGSCSRCVPDCSGHGRCNESWLCGEWLNCSNGNQMRRCMDSSFCNTTIKTEARACGTDACSSNSDCPADANCARYFCEGSPKACKPYVMIPCCGDGRCEGDGDCISDCPPAPCNCSQAQCPPCNQTQNFTNASFSGHFVINEIMYNPINESGGEYVEIFNPMQYEANLSGIILSDNNENDTVIAFANGSLMLQPMSYAVITNMDTFLRPTVLHLSVDDSKIGNGLSNTGDWVILYLQNSSIADMLNYTEMKPYCNDGFSLEKCLNDTWICHINGTMGVQNFC